MNGFEARGGAGCSVYIVRTKARLDNHARRHDSHGGAAQYSHCAATSRNYCGGSRGSGRRRRMLPFGGSLVVVVVSFSFFTFL